VLNILVLSLGLFFGSQGALANGNNQLMSSAAIPPPVPTAGEMCARALRDVENYPGGTGNYLDLSFIRGLEGSTLFEELENGASYTGSAGTFVCGNCSEVFDFATLNGVPRSAHFQCTSCGDPVDINESSMPPLIVINAPGPRGDRIYVMKHSIINNGAAWAFFKDEANTCENCGTFYIDSRFDLNENGVADGEEGCPGCGSHETKPWVDPYPNGPPVYTLRQIRRNPELIVRPLVEVGIIPMSTAKRNKLLPSRDLFLIEQRRYVELGSDYDEHALIKRAILNGSLHPWEAQRGGIITRSERREILTELIRSGELVVHDALFRGWIAKGWATTNFDVDLTRVDPETRRTIAQLPEFLPGQEEALLASRTGHAAEEDFGEEDPNITGTNVNETLANTPSMLWQNSSAPMGWSNLTVGAKRVIKVVATTAVVTAVAAGLVNMSQSEGKGPLATGTIDSIQEVGVVFEDGVIAGRELSAEQMRQHYAGVHIDVDFPPPYVEIIQNQQLNGSDADMEDGVIEASPENAEDIYIYTSVTVEFAEGIKHQTVMPGTLEMNWGEQALQVDQEVNVVWVDATGESLFNFQIEAVGE
jgi:hypothetical protein